MAFSRPKLSIITGRVKAVLAAGTGADPRLDQTNTAAVANAVGGVSHGLHGHIDDKARQLFSWSADEEQLVYKGQFWGVPRKQPAKANGQISGTGQTGAVIPAGHLCQRSDGREYQTTAEVTLAAGVFEVNLEALVEGLDGDCPAGTELSMITPITGINTAVTVGSVGLSGGADLEALADWRERIAAKARKDVPAGNGSRYVEWALKVSGVTRAWAYPRRTGLGTVGLSFVYDGRTSIIPTSAELTAMADHIEEHLDAETGQTTGAPCFGEVQVFAFDEQAINPEIQLKTNTTQAVKDAIEAGFKDLIFREGEPEGTLLITHIREEISLAAGEYDHVLISPTADIDVDTGNIPIFGAITWS